MTKKPEVKISILNWMTGAVIYESDKPTLKEAVVDANLRGADLYGADLLGANLYGADLRGADLRGADLYGAKNSAYAEAQTVIVPDGSIIGYKMAWSAGEKVNAFGAEWGIGEGLTGHCYAFPTLDKEMRPLLQSDLIDSRHKLYATCNALPEKTFLLTAVGTGIAGNSHDYMKEIFTSQATPGNLILPEEWR